MTNHRTRRERTPLVAEMIERAQQRQAASQRRVELYSQALDDAAGYRDEPYIGATAATPLEQLLDRSLHQGCELARQLEQAEYRYAQAAASDEVLAQLRQRRSRSADPTGPVDYDIIDIVAHEVP